MIDVFGNQGNVYLFFRYTFMSCVWFHIMYLTYIVSVCQSCHFQGIAKMESSVCMDRQFQLWQKNKYEGVFRVKWLYVKDIKNFKLKHIRLPNNANQSVCASRDIQEVPKEQVYLV